MESTGGEIVVVPKIKTEIEDDEQLVCTPDLDNTHSSEPPSTPAIEMCPQMMGLGRIPTFKRKRKVMPLEKKIEVIKRLEAGERLTSLAKQYSVGRATIFDIKQKKDSILSFASNLKDENVLKTRKTMRIPMKKLKTMFKEGFMDPGRPSLEDCGRVASVSFKIEKDCEDATSGENNQQISPIRTFIRDSFTCDEVRCLDSSHHDVSWVKTEYDESELQGDEKQSKNESSRDSYQGAIVLKEPSFSDCVAIPSKRKHVVLSLETKIEILQRLDNGETGTSLAPLYNVGRATISDIKNKRESILMFASKLKSEEGLKKRKTMRKAHDIPLENAVFMWYRQEVNRGVEVTGPKICEKALEMNRKLGGQTNFKASTGWLKNFKARHDIRWNQDVAGDHDANAINAFTWLSPSLFLEKYTSLLLQDGFHPEDIYCADETVVDWQAMPRNSTFFDCPLEREPVTVLLCANLSWNHSLPLLVVGRRSKKEYFKHVSCIPVAYRKQKSGWMDTELFMSWFANDFIAAVKKEREIKGRRGKVLLLIDNAPFHPIVDMLNRVDENFEVMFLPPDRVGSSHPMHQNGTQELKRLFKIGILRRLLSARQDEQSVVQCVEDLSLKECCHILAGVWNNLSQENKKAAMDELGGVSSRGDEQYLLEVTDLFVKIPGLTSCSLSDAEEWINIDSSDPGERILDEDEILRLVQEVESCEEDDNDTASSMQEVWPESAGMVPESPEEGGPTHGEAYRAFETVMAWCEQQQDTLSSDLVLLKRLRDLAVKKAWDVVDLQPQNAAIKAN